MCISTDEISEVNISAYMKSQKHFCNPSKPDIHRILGNFIVTRVDPTTATGGRYSVTNEKIDPVTEISTKKTNST
jgi:hypothetical protein